MAVEPQVQVEREALVFRIIWMLVFALAWQVAEVLLLVVVLVQVGYRLFNGRLHRGLRAFGGALACFLGQVASYLTFASDEKPWPFAPWPQTQDEPEQGPQG